MDEIRRLQRALYEAQLTSSVSRLSEGNVIELVSKMVQGGMLDVVFTSDGKEYVTPKQLRREVSDEIYVHGGRVSLTDLQTAVNVDTRFVEETMKGVAQQDPSVHLIQGELVTGDYLEDICEEVNESLTEDGFLFIAELAKRFGFPTDFIRHAIEQRLGSVISGTLQRGILYTQAFVERHKAQIRGLFSAITRPTPVSEILCANKFQENLFYSVLQDLLDEGRLLGHVRGQKGSGAHFTPSIFAQAQQESVEMFYQHNGFITFSTLDNLKVNNPKQYVRSRFPDGIALDTCFVNSTMQEQLNATIEETIIGETYLDVKTVVPPVLTDMDISSLLHLCPILQGSKAQAQVLGTHFIVANQMIAAALKKFEVLFRESAEVAKPLGRDPQSSSDAKTKRLGKEVREEEEEEEEIPVTQKGNRGKKKGAGRSKRGKAPSGGESAVEGKEEQQPLPDEQVTSYLQEWFDDLEEEVAVVLSGFLGPQLGEVQASVARHVFTASAAARRERQEKLTENLRIAYENVCLATKGVQIMGATGNVVDRLVVRTLCTDIANLLVEMQALLHFEEPNFLLASASDRKNVVSSLPDEDVRHAFADLEAALAKKNASEFVEMLETYAPTLGTQLKKVDKKRERQLLFAQRQMYLKKMAELVSPDEVFLTIVQLAFLQVCNAAVHANGACVPTLLEVLKPRLPSNSYSMLTEAQGLIASYLKARSTPHCTEEDEAGVHRLHEVLEQLKAVAATKDGFT